MTGHERETTTTAEPVNFSGGSSSRPPPRRSGSNCSGSSCGSHRQHNLSHSSHGLGSSSLAGGRGARTPSVCSRGGDFFMGEVDISRNHGHGTVPVPGRESHTADLEEFDRYVKIMEEADRLEQDLQWDVEENGEDDDDSLGDSLGESFEGELERRENSLAAYKAAASIGGAPMKPSYRPDRTRKDGPVGMNIKMDDLNLDNDGESKAAADVLDSGLSDSHGNFGREESGSFIPDKEEQEKIAQQREMEARTRYPFNAKFWAFVRSILVNAKPVGFDELSDPKKAASKGPEDASAFLGKVIAIGPLNPIQPAIIAEQGGFTEDEVLAELFYGTLVGLVAMRFAPECIQCGSAVMDTDMLGRVPSRALCGGCNQPNVIESMDKIKVMFLLNSDVLYILAENYACTPSAESMSHTSVFAAVPANSTGSGYSYCIGTGKDTEIAPALKPGKYRMHCPVAKTDNYLVVRKEADDGDKAVTLNMKVSDLVYSHKKGKRKAELIVPHGRIKFDIFPDTRSFFVLWVQNDTDDKALMHLPDEERSPYTSAARVIHHPIFNALFQENQVVSVQKNVFLSISNVVLVFTDIVDSTKLYASLGDGKAFTLVRKHFQVLFGAFTRNGGRVVKTIGDAVMASFTTGSAALTAVSEAMELLPTIGRRPDNNNFIEIRVGIHSGQATVVPLNGVNDYFGQTANIAARVQSAAKASECFVTEMVLGSEDAMSAYNEIVDGDQFQPTPVTELKLKGVDGKVHARGFRRSNRSRRMSDASRTSFSSYANRRVNRSYSIRGSIDSCGSDDDADAPGAVKPSFSRPGELGRRGSKLDAHNEE